MDNLTLYYCCAQEDKAFREELEKHLEALKRQRTITTWHDDEMQAGIEWQRESVNRLNTADIILLLVSSDLLALDNFAKEALNQAFARHNRKDALLIPVLLRPVDLEGTLMSKLKALPTDNIPITKWHNRDDAFFDIVKGIRQAIGTFMDGRNKTLSDNFTIDIERVHDMKEGAYHTMQSVFLFNAPLTDINEFYGRIRERTTLLDRTYKGIATSIVGPRRIGKTWLMQYMKLVAPTQFGSRFLIAYIDATSPRCTTVSGFVSSVLEELKVFKTQLNEQVFDLAYMERIIKNLKKQGYMPVLCIDEFEGLTSEDTFDIRFFTGLRAIAEAGLALVVASKHSLIDLVSSTLKTSPFFNIFEKLSIKSFSLKEAERFVYEKAQLAGFDAHESSLLLIYGRVEEQSWSPIRLQLVGTLMLQEKKLAQQEDLEYYRPADPAYWQDFEKRLEEKYQEVEQ